MKSKNRKRFIILFLLILITAFIIYISTNIINNNNAAKSTSADILSPIATSDCITALSFKSPPIVPDALSIQLASGTCGGFGCSSSTGRSYKCSYKVGGVDGSIYLCQNNAIGCSTNTSPSSSSLSNGYGCSSGAQCPSCAYPQSAYCFANKSGHNNGGTPGCGCAGVNQGDAGNYCTGYTDQAATLCPGSGNQLCTPGTTGCNGNASAKCTSCSNAFNYGCTISTGGSASSFANGQCGSCSGCYTPSADPSPTACALIDGVCSKAGYCAPGAVPTHSEKGFIFCQDDNGPVYPLPGVVANVTFGNNQLLNTSDSNGNISFGGLQSYPYTNFGAGLKINNDDKQAPFTNQDSSYNYNNLTVPGTGQPYTKLKGATLQNCYDSNHQYFYCSDGENGFRNNNGYYCNATPTTGPDSSATAYFFGVPSYGEGRSGLVYRFTNCSPSAPPAQPITIPVHVQCKAADGTIYPVTGATIDLQQSNPTQIIKQNTDQNGDTNYVLPSSNTGLIAVRLEYPLPSGTLSNGQPYSQIGGAVATNCADGSLTNCSGSGVGGGNYCGNGSNNTSTYEACQLNTGANPAPQSFLFQFSNCNPPPPPTVVECNATCNASNICDASQGLSCQTGVNPNVCRLSSNTQSSNCTPIATVGCNANCDSNNICDASQGLSCQTGVNPNVCRLSSNTQSSTCTPITTVGCNANCDSNNICDSSKGLSCQTGVSPNVCRLSSNTQSSTCTPIATVGCNANCDANNICDSSKGLSCQTGVNPNVCRLSSNTTSINCSSTSANSVNINVKAFCQDGNGPQYPIQNLTINANGTSYTPPNQTTDVYGNTQFISAIQGNGPFNISVAGISGATLVGSSQSINSLNQPVSALNCSTGSSIGCSGNVNGNYCGPNNASYTSCNLAGNNSTTPAYNFAFKYTNCIPVQCKDISKIGSDPVKAGPGNIVSFKVRYQNTSTTNPYPNIKLRVSPTGSATPIVGRDNNNTGVSLVAPSSSTPPSFDSSLFIWTYIFTWESSDPAPSTSPTVAGSYDVKVLPDGLTPASETACSSSLTVSQTAQPQPIFSIVKQNIQVCDVNGNDTLNYTIIVKNIGPVSGVINNIKDTYDPLLTSLNITPTNLNPSGVVANGIITWSGTTADNTFTPNQSKSYTYQVVIPQNMISKFASGLKNHADVGFNNIGTPTKTSDSSIDLIVKMACNTVTSSTKPLPNTALEDTRFLLVGLILIFVGYLTYRYRVGRIATTNLLINVETKAEDLKENVEVIKKDLRRSIMPFEESSLDNIDEKIENQIKKKRNRSK